MIHLGSLSSWTCLPQPVCKKVLIALSSKSQMLLILHKLHELSTIGNARKLTSSWSSSVQPQACCSGGSIGGWRCSSSCTKAPAANDRHWKRKGWPLTKYQALHTSVNINLFLTHRHMAPINTQLAFHTASLISMYVWGQQWSLCHGSPPGIWIQICRFCPRKSTYGSCTYNNGSNQISTASLNKYGTCNWRRYLHAK